MDPEAVVNEREVGHALLRCLDHRQAQVGAVERVNEVRADALRLEALVHLVLLSGQSDDHPATCQHGFNTTCLLALVSLKDREAVRGGPPNRQTFSRDKGGRILQPVHGLSRLHHHSVNRLGNDLGHVEGSLEAVTLEGPRPLPFLVSPIGRLQCVRHDLVTEPILTGAVAVGHGRSLEAAPPRREGEPLLGDVAGGCEGGVRGELLALLCGPLLQLFLRLVPSSQLIRHLLIGHGCILAHPFVCLLHHQRVDVSRALSGGEVHGSTAYLILQCHAEVLDTRAGTVQSHREAGGIAGPVFLPARPLVAGSKELEGAVRLGPPQVTERVFGTCDDVGLVIVDPLHPVLQRSLVDLVKGPGIGEVDGEEWCALLIQRLGFREVQQTLHEIGALRVELRDRVDAPSEVELVREEQLLEELILVRRGQCICELRPLGHALAVLPVDLGGHPPPLLPCLLIGLDVMRLRGQLVIVPGWNTSVSGRVIPNVIEHVEDVEVHGPRGALGGVQRGVNLRHLCVLQLFEVVPVVRLDHLDGLDVAGQVAAGGRCFPVNRRDHHRFIDRGQQACRLVPAVDPLTGLFGGLEVGDGLARSFLNVGDLNQTDGLHDDVDHFHAKVQLALLRPVVPLDLHLVQGEVHGGALVSVVVALLSFLLQVVVEVPVVLPHLAVTDLVLDHRADVKCEGLKTLFAGDGSEHTA